MDELKDDFKDFEKLLNKREDQKGWELEYESHFEPILNKIFLLKYLHEK